MLRIWLFVGIAVSLGACVSTSEAQDQDEVVAHIGDSVITLGDVDDTWHREDPRGRLQTLQELYETRLRVLDIAVGEYLINREARSRGIGRDELLSEELPSRTDPVSDTEVELLYERNKDRVGGRTLDEMRPEIRSILEQQRPARALRDFMRELRASAEDVVVTLNPPRQNVEMSVDDRSKGPANAPIVIVEFSDFECPYCKQATDTLTELLERYPDEIRFVYKDFPLPSHPNAFMAAEAGHCAHDQGQFWEFHDRLFANQDALDIESLRTYAGDLDIDVDVFTACLDDSRHEETVNQEISIGRSYGATSTPTLFINGRPILGAMPLETFDEIVREELAAAARR